MAYRCDICEKRTQAGRQHTHRPGVAGGQWKKRANVTLRKFRPNLHTATMVVNGVTQTVRACTKCIKRMKFDMKKATTPVAAV